jgi:hypothetical protein
MLGKRWYIQIAGGLLIVLFLTDILQMYLGLDLFLSRIITLISVMLFVILVNVIHKPKSVKTSPFTMLGIYGSESEQASKLSSEAVEKGLRIEVPSGEMGAYYQLVLSEGVELWVAVDNTQNIVDGMPYFRARNRNKVVIKGDQPAKSGKWFGYFSAAPSEGTEFPFLFDCPDYLVHVKERFPKEVEVSLTGFVNRINVFDSEKEFKDKSHMATESFIPSGTFEPKDGKVKHPTPEAVFSGVIQEGMLLTNSKTSEQFYWASVKTLSLTIDIVVD